MKHVLYIGPDYNNHRGGIGAVLEVYAKNIVPFKFISTYRPGSSSITRLQVYIKAFIRLIWLLSTDRDIKILHIHTASRGSFLRKSFLMLIGRVFRKKTVLHIHGGGFHIFYANSKFLKPYIKFILESADVIVCLSEKWRTYYSSTFKLKRLEVVKNVIEKALVLPSGIKDNGRINLLFLGLIRDEKGIFDLLKMLAANKQTFKDKVSVTIAGNGEIDRLQKIIKDNHSNGEVIYAGWVNGTVKAELLSVCDIYILPSYNEGLPVSILEAMAYAKPVIATDVGGIPELVKPGYNGWLFKPGDQEMLQSVISEAISNKSILKTYGNNSLSLSEAYTPEAVFQSLKIIYERLVSQ